MAADLYVLGTPTLVEGSSVAITGSTAAAGLPVSNLLTPYPHEKWRSSGVSSVYFELDLASAQAIYALWLGYTNFKPGTTQWRVRAATSQGNLTAAPDYDSGTVYATAYSSYSSSTYSTDWPVGTHALLYSGGVTWTALATKRWWRVDVSGDPGDGYFQAGRLIPLGAGWKPAHGPAYGATIPTERPGKTWQRSKGGILFTNDEAIPTVEEFEFQYLTASEVADLRTLYRTRGTYREVLSVWLDGSNNAEQTVLHGYLGQVDSITLPGIASGAKRFRARVEVESAA